MQRIKRLAALAVPIFSCGFPVLTSSLVRGLILAQLAPTRPVSFFHLCKRIAVAWISGRPVVALSAAAYVWDVQTQNNRGVSSGEQGRHRGIQ